MTGKSFKDLFLNTKCNISFEGNEQYLGCGGLFNIQAEVNGQISFWPEDGYSNNFHCEWFMEMPVDSLISISYSDFNLESSSDTACSADYLLIRNDNDDAAGPVSTLPIMAKQCGTTIPSDLLLRGNRLLLVFHSNHENNYRGFKMNYEIIKEGFQISDFYS